MRKGEVFINNEIVEQLYELYYKQLYLYVYSMCKNKTVAEDLTQDTFLKAILSLNNNHQNVQAWLFLVAKNLCINYIKKNRETLNFKELDSVQDSALSPIDKIISDDRNRHLMEAIDKLPDNKKQVLQLQYFGGLSQKEIAQIMNLTPNNIRVISMRAKAELKKYLEEAHYDIS